VTRRTEANTSRGFGSTSASAGANVRRCQNCQSDQHLIKNCDKLRKNSNTQEKLPNFQNSRANQIQVIPTEEVNEETDVKVVTKCGVNLKPTHQKIMSKQMNFKQATMKDDSNALKRIQLEYVAVEIRGKETDKSLVIKVNALLDSGAEIPAISKELLGTSWRSEFTMCSRRRESS